MSAKDENNDGKTDNDVGQNGWDNTIENDDSYNDVNGDLESPKDILDDTDEDVDGGIPLSEDLDYRDNQGLTEEEESEVNGKSDSGSGNTNLLLSFDQVKSFKSI